MCVQNKNPNKTAKTGCELSGAVPDAPRFSWRSISALSDLGDSDVGDGRAAGAHGGSVEREPWQPHDGCQTLTPLSHCPKGAATDKQADGAGCL